MRASPASAPIADEFNWNQAEPTPRVRAAEPWLKAKLLFGHPVQAVDCVVTHITHHEARIIAWPGVEMPARLHLLLPGEATAYEAEVVSAAGFQFDLRLAREIPIEGVPWRAAPR